MITGLFPPTTGTAFINGLDIRYEIDEIRKTLGLCPQHDVLFNELTVKEHLIFYCRLKGMFEYKLIKAEVNKYIKMLAMEPQRHKLIHKLSGGMKRKLSTAIALVDLTFHVTC